MNSPKGGSQTPRGRAFPGQNLSQRREEPPVAPTTKEALRPMGTPRSEQAQSPSTTPRQLLIYDETPQGDHCLHYGIYVKQT